MVIASFPLPAGRGRGGPALTAAERDVVTGVLEGQKYAEIARQRGRSVETVAKQATSAFRKLGVSSRSELVAQGILPVRAGEPEES
jgi:DNA-binding CsgD family transcriptional regulator